MSCSFNFENKLGRNLSISMVGVASRDTQPMDPSSSCCVIAYVTLTINHRIVMNSILVFLLFLTSRISISWALEEDSEIREVDANQLGNKTKYDTSY